MGNAHARHHAPLLLKMAAFATTTPALKAEFRGQTAALKRVQPVKAAAVNTVTEAKIKVAINGFGRIGRNFLRCWHGRAESGLEVVAINDSGGVKQASHLVKYDSILGTFDADVAIVDDTHISIDGKSIEIVSNRDPTKLPWKALGVQIVIEGTGVFIDTPGASKHLEAGAEKVIITAPAKGDDIPTYVMGVNADQSTHSYTGDQRILDASHRDLRRARAAALNIVPTSTGAAKAVALVLPQLKGKLNGIALRVPTPNVSIVDLVCNVEKKGVTAEEVNAAFKEAADGPMKGVLAITETPLVSVDFRCSDVSTTIDAALTMVMGDDMVKVVAWYDNEWGYTQRVVDLTHIVAKGLIEGGDVSADPMDALCADDPSAEECKVFD